MEGARGREGEGGEGETDTEREKQRRRSSLACFWVGCCFGRSDMEGRRDEGEEEPLHTRLSFHISSPFFFARVGGHQIPL